MTACSLFLAAANVYLRDVQHLLEVFLLFWFWMNPIVYPVNQMLLGRVGVHKVFGVRLATLYFLNPMADIVINFQRVFYQHLTYVGKDGTKVLALYQGSDASYLAHALGVLVVSFGLLFLAQRYFARAQGNFAQEL